MTTLDFELEINPGAADTYPVLARAPSGEATATMRLPEAWSTILFVIRVSLIDQYRSRSGRCLVATRRTFDWRNGPSGFVSLATVPVGTAYVEQAWRP